MWHRLAASIEDAGFEIRDTLMWLYGSGFPKGETCLKPAWEPMLLARKKSKTALPLNLDACRIGTQKHLINGKSQDNTFHGGFLRMKDEDRERTGRYLRQSR
jgi:site-specific DNA-methyltransferase (adenine-specific)